ncbi:MAG: benzoyl-CoA reductase, bzd-type, subunit O [Deltaproteobacteria bacterium]|nr:benzoyl-CoA reductase, bzd-type, subunit O [Deltaproteobacteria bacterium]
MSEAIKYKTKPFECWEKAKELRTDNYKEIATAREKGKLLISGGTESLISMPSGLGDYEFLGGEPYGASVSLDPRFAERCAEAAESKGYARDFCAYARNYIGSMFLNEYAFGGEFPKPDFCLQTHFCDTHGKWYQIVSEYEKVPYFCVDGFPFLWDETETSKKLKVDYIVSQLHDAIEWMEKVTGRKYDDEKLIEAINNECESTSLWAECCALNKTIPAPMDEKTMFSFYVIAVLMRQKKKSVEFYRMLRDEVKDRVENQIAAVSTERCRLLHDSQPPWAFIRIFRYLEKFGVVSVGAHYSFGLSGGWAKDEDGTWGPAKTPKQRGITLSSRDDALRTLAEWYLGHHTIARSLRFSGPGKNGFILDLLKQWHCQGMMIHLNRGCEGGAVGQMEVRLAALNAGIPVMTYEGNVADPREFDEARTMARIEAFMETLDLKKLTD